MILKPIRSGHLVGYDHLTREMQIAFPDGALYSYPHTCMCTYRGIVGAWEAGLIIANLPKGRLLSRYEHQPKNVPQHRL